MFERLTPFLPLVGAVVLVACSAPTAPATAPSAVSPGPQQPAQVKPKVDRLVFAVTPPPSESNEPRMLTAPSSWQLRPMYEYVIGVDATTGKLAPQLAASWAVEPDGSSVRFKLHQGVQFHGGAGAMTAKDLVHTWQDLIREDSFSSQAPYLRGLIGQIDTPSDSEAIVKLSRPDGNFFTVVSEQAGSMEVRSKSDFDRNGRPTMTSEPTAGTGPYQFRERQQSSFIRFARVPFKHWRSTPDFPEFEFRWVKEASTRLAALIAHEAQITDLPSDLKAQAVQRGFTLLPGKVQGARVFISHLCCYVKDVKDPSQGYMFPNGPLTDPKVRRALSKAVNRDDLNKAFFGGKGEPMYLSNFNSQRRGWNPDWDKRFQDEYGYDPAKARALLAEAGYGPGKPLQTNIFLNSNQPFPGSGDLAEAMVTYWRAVGVNAQLLQTDVSEIDRVRRQFKYENESIAQITGADQFTSINVYNSYIGPRGLGVESFELETILNQIKNTLDEKRQEELWRQLGDITYNLHTTIPLFWVPAEAVADPKVVAAYTYPSSISGTWTHVDTIKAAP